MTSDGDLPSVEMTLVPTAVTRGAPARSAERRGRLLRDGEGRVGEPAEEALAARGAVAVHHWVHTWLDGPDARQ